MTADLVAFLKARLDEDEQVALAATPGPWRWDLDGGAFDGEDPPPRQAGEDGFGHHGPDLVTVAEHDAAVGTRTIRIPTSVITSTGYDADNVIVKRADAEHIARHDPAWVLRDVEAKRRVIDLHSRGGEPSDHLCRECANPYPCETVRLHALPDADHPDYRPEDRP